MDMSFFYFLCFGYVLSSTCYDVFCHRSILTCFVVYLLKKVIVLSTISFFMSFRIDSSYEKKFDPTESSHKI